MINSCIYPHVRYDTCNPIKHNINLNDCLKNSGSLLKYLRKKSSYGFDPVLDDLVNVDELSFGSPSNGTVRLKEKDMDEF
jgi:hypothetical protein